MTSPIADDCPFCKRIAAGEYDDRSRRFDAVTFEPLNPVTPGHRLVVPVSHVRGIANHPQISADVMAYAVMLASAGEYQMDEFNLITSVGAAATQTVLHMHLHLVPRWPDDGLHLPWTGQREREREIVRHAEVLHADHHPGTFVPTLDSCPEHDRADYEARVRKMRQAPEIVR